MNYDRWVLVLNLGNKLIHALIDMALLALYIIIVMQLYYPHATIILPIDHPQIVIFAIIAYKSWWDK
jgi:hypothetical protein